MTAFGVEHAAGQKPFAVILGCSDSRVPIETLFDQEPGNIFVVRVAGNFVNDDGLGSIEFSLEILKSSLVMVLGHSGCGAVGAAMQLVNEGTIFPGHIARIAESIVPAALATRCLPNAYDAAIARNVQDNVRAITERSALIADAVKSNRASVVGAVYDLRTGMVSVVE